MYKLISDLNPKDKIFKDLAFMPGFNIVDNVVTKNIHEIINLESNITKDKDVINDKIFIKFYTSISESNNIVQFKNNSYFEYLDQKVLASTIPVRGIGSKYNNST